MLWTVFQSGRSSQSMYRSHSHLSMTDMHMHLLVDVHGQTPALSRISKNRRAGNFYAIGGGAQILKIDGRFDLYE